MPNHVHLLVTPKVVAARWLAPLKGFTAHAANELLGAHGRPFWQDESYDHLVRSATEFERIRGYIEDPTFRNTVILGARNDWQVCRIPSREAASHLDQIRDPMLMQDSCGD